MDLISASLSLEMELKWDNIRVKCFLHAVSVLYDLMAAESRAPVYLRNLFSGISERAGPKTRLSRGGVKTSARRLKLTSRMFSSVAGTLWNDLPPACWTCQTITEFRQKALPFLHKMVTEDGRIVTRPGTRR
jgi:hypothetical protein